MRKVSLIAITLLAIVLVFTGLLNGRSIAAPDDPEQALKQRPHGIPTGRPAITPSQQGALSITDVRDAFAKNPFLANNPRIIATVAPVITSIEFMTEAELRVRTHGETTGLPDTTPLCYVTLSGTFVTSGPRGAATRTTTTEVLVFDIRTGNLLLSGS